MSRKKNGKILVIVTTQVGDHDGWGSYSHTILKMARNSSFEVKLVSNAELEKHEAKIVVPSYSPRFQIKLFWKALRFIPFHSTVHVLVEPYGLAVILASKLKIAKSVITLHGTYSLISWKSIEESLRSCLRLLVMTLTNRLTSGSIHIKSQLPNYIQRKCHLIPNAVDSSIYKKINGDFKRELNPYKKPIFLSVGELKMRKGQLSLIEVFAKNEYLNNNSVLLLIGKYTQEVKNEIDAISKKYALDEKMFALGRLDTDSLIKFYNMAICTILFARTTSKATHGYPMIIHESNMCGAPIIISKGSSDPSSVLEGINGFWVDEGDDLQLALKMEKMLLLEGAEVLQLRDSCYENAIKYTTEVLAPSLLNLYKF